MRLPFVRKAGDDSPYSWWEWALFPIFLPLFFLALCVAAVVSIPMSAKAMRRMRRDEEAFRGKLAVSGRYVEWKNLEARASAGQGTLVRQIIMPKGPVRHWWTEDDLIAKAPVTLPYLTEKQRPEEEQEKLRSYAAQCDSMCSETGLAKLTQAPREVLDGESSVDRHPLAKVLQLESWGPSSSLVVLSPRRASEKHSFVIMSFGNNWTLEWDDTSFRLKDPAGQARIDVDARLGHREVDPHSLQVGTEVRFLRLWRIFFFPGDDADEAMIELRRYVTAGWKADPDGVDRLRKRVWRRMWFASGLFVCALVLFVLLGWTIIGKAGPVERLVNTNPGISFTTFILSFAVVVLSPVMAYETFKTLRFLSRYEIKGS